MTIVNKAPSATFEMDISGPVPMRWYITDADGVATSRPSTLVCEVSYNGTSIVTLTVGAGIVLSTYLTVANALATTTLTTAQLAGYTAGMQLDAEWREGTPGAVVMRGKLNLV